MNPLRIFLLVALVLVVFSIGNAEAEAKEPEWSSVGSGYIHSIAISADGEYIAISTSSNGIYLFDKDSNTPLWNYPLVDHTHSIAISADGEYIVAGNQESRVYLFNKESNVPLWSYTIGCGLVPSVAISADGEYIVAGSHRGCEEGGNLYFFGKDNETPLWTYKGGYEVNSVDISADGEYIAVDFFEMNENGTRWRSIRLFDKDSSTPLWSYETGEDFYSVSFSTDGEYIVAGINDGKVYLFGKDSSTPLWSYEAGSQVNSVAISADGKYIAAGTENKVYLFDKDNSTPLWSYDTTYSVNTVAISADGEYIVASSDDFFGSGEGHLYFFDKANSTPIWDNSNIGGVGPLEISADGKYLVVNGGNGKIHLYKTNFPPTAIIDSINPSPAKAGTTVFFNGIGLDIGGTVVTYRWNSSFDGVLSTEANFSSSTLSLGLHNITFQVQDDDGEWSNETSKMLYIGTPPVALANDIGWNDEDPKNKVKPGDEAIFKGGGNDEDGTIVLYEWDFNGDGEFDWSSKETGSTTFVYIKEGTYNATLRVTDNDGFTDTDYRLITVSEDDGDGGGGSIPSISLITSLISIGLVTIFRRK